MLPIPQYASVVLDMLHRAGFEAYLVGGCVRDSIMGNEPGDYDITTSALPEQTKEVFRDMRVIETGIKHGTVTVLSQGYPVEITTFRVDGSYSDSRHPDSVTFTRSLREDLARRDFTCNALAYCDESGIVDPFGGIGDIERRIIRAVGEPECRFSEDALRILRALRFSSVLGFSIDDDTVRGMRQCIGRIDDVAGERIYVELSKLLCGDNVGDVLRRYPDMIDAIIPGFARMQGFDQHSPYHIHDVLEHTICAVENVPPIVHLRLAALLHDIGKPDCFTIDEKGVGHFYGHASYSAAVAERLLYRLRCDNATSSAVLTLVRDHDIHIFPPDEHLMLRRLSRFGEPMLRDLIALKRADTLAHSPDVYDRLDALDEAIRILDRLIEKQSCFSLRQLAVGGRDLIFIGFTPGKQLGDTLDRLLEAVIDGECENERDALLELAGKALSE